MDLLLTDAIGPFFRGLDRGRINWSKIPFDHWETGGAFPSDRLSALQDDLRRFAAGAAAAGFNAATLDDLAHLARDPAHPPAIRDLVESFRHAYCPLLAILTDAGLRPWITADVLSLPVGAPEPGPDWTERYARVVDGFFADFPEVHGLVTRIGESDGLDVRGAFRSRLAVRTVADARVLLAALLPVCERHGRTLVFRTWSVGAYPIGDLQWNRDTFRAVFDGFDSPRLVISIKHGESDFFRYLAVNKQFFRTAHRKLIEVPARREYEGCGEYPSFTGWDYEQYRRELSRAVNVVGIQCWVQTGGWTAFRRLTWVENSSVWTELNAFVTVAIFRDGMRAEEAVRAWHRARRNEAEGTDAEGADALVELLRLDDEVIKQLLYLEEQASRKLFFRRTRVPPLLSVYWDHVLVNHAMRKLLSSFVREPEEVMRRTWAALDKLADMRDLAERAAMPVEDIDFMRHTFEILALAREYYLLPWSPRVAAQLESLRAEYRHRYAHRVPYAVKLDFRPFRLRRLWLRWLVRLLLRRKRGYRVLDHLFTVRLLGRIHPWLLRRPSLRGGHFQDQAMGIDAVLK